MSDRGIAICTYNRGNQLGDIIRGVLDTKPPKCRLVVCDDGSTDDTPYVVSDFSEVIYIRGPNKGVGANKNRALWALQDCHFLAIIEDDLMPISPGWFDLYENTAVLTGIHHFCRVQDKEVSEKIPEFTEWLSKYNTTPIYGDSVRGDFTFLTASVIKGVGGFNALFQGAGYAHGEWSERVVKAGLIPHPLKWVDIKEARDMFVQKGDREGGRWMESKNEIKQQLKGNASLLKRLRREEYVFHPLVMS